MDMSVYLDTLVIVNTYIGWLLISLCRRLAHLSVGGKRMALGAFLSGITALIIVIPNKSALAGAAIAALKLVSCPVISFAAFYKKGMSLKRYFFATTVFTIATVLFGGGIYMLQSLIKTNVIYFSNYSCYFDIPLSTLVLLTGLIYLVMLIMSHFFSKEADKSHSYTVGFSVNDQSYILEGVLDTGNTVKDLFSGKHVIVCQGLERSPPEKGVRVVPYSTVSGEGILYAFSPDSIYIEDESGKRKDVSALVAFVSGGKKRAVFNPKILL